MIKLSPAFSSYMIFSSYMFNSYVSGAWYIFELIFAYNVS